MTCPKCHSHQVLVQQQTWSQLKNAHHSIFWWIFIGWWWVPVKWIFLFVPALLAKIFVPKRQETGAAALYRLHVPELRPQLAALIRCASISTKFTNADDTERKI